VEEFSGVDQDLTLGELHGLFQATDVGSSARVVRHAGEHEIPGDVAPVVMHLDATVGGRNVGSVLEEVRLLDGVIGERQERAKQKLGVREGGWEDGMKI